MKQKKAVDTRYNILDFITTAYLLHTNILCLQHLNDIRNEIYCCFCCHVYTSQCKNAIFTSVYSPENCNSSSYSYYPFKKQLPVMHHTQEHTLASASNSACSANKGTLCVQYATPLLRSHLGMFINCKVWNGLNHIVFWCLSNCSIITWMCLSSWEYNHLGNLNISLHQCKMSTWYL